MTTELTKAAPNNHGPIYETDLYDFAGWLTTRPGVMAVGSSCEAGPMAEAVGEYIKTFPERFALTQRPAAQTEREAFEAGRAYAIATLRPQAVPMTEDAARLDWMASRSAHIGWDRDGDFCRVWAIEDEEIGQAPITGWHDSARDAIDAARGITAPAGGEKQA